MGYSLWLELAQWEIDDCGRGDLDRALDAARRGFRLGGAIPAPHVTALYGIEGMDEVEVRQTFREDVRQVLADAAATRRNGDGNDAEKWWPDLTATGILVGAEYAGVDGGLMVRDDALLRRPRHVRSHFLSPSGSDSRTPVSGYGLG